MEYASRRTPGERQVEGVRERRLRTGRSGGSRRPQPRFALSHGARSRGSSPGIRAAAVTRCSIEDAGRVWLLWEHKMVIHRSTEPGELFGMRFDGKEWSKTASRPLRTDPVRSTLQPPCRRWKVDDSRPRSSTQLSHLARRTRKGGAHPCAVERRGLEATRASTARFRSAAFGRNRWQNPTTCTGVICTFTVHAYPRRRRRARRVTALCARQGQDRRHGDAGKRCLVLAGCRRSRCLPRRHVAGSVVSRRRLP